MNDRKCVVCGCCLSIYNEGRVCFPCNKKPFSRTFQFKSLINGKMIDGERHFIDREKAIVWYARKKRTAYSKAAKLIGE